MNEPIREVTETDQRDFDTLDALGSVPAQSVFGIDDQESYSDEQASFAEIVRGADVDDIVAVANELIDRGKPADGINYI